MAAYAMIGKFVGVVAGALTFLIAWFIITSDFGILGFCFGWIPASVGAMAVAGLSGLVWPAVILVLFLGLRATFV